MRKVVRVTVHLQANTLSVPIFVCFIHSIHIQKWLYFFHSTYYLSAQQYIYQTLWSGEKLCHSEFKSAHHYVKDGKPEQCISRHWKEWSVCTFTVPVAILRMLSNLSSFHLGGRHNRHEYTVNDFIYMYQVNFPKGTINPCIHYRYICHH